VIYVIKGFGQITENTSDPFVTIDASEILLVRLYAAVSVQELFLKPYCSAANMLLLIT